jgi:ABC-2 type transport system ATP-binding protein
MRLEAVGKRYGLRQPWIVRDVTRDVAAGQLIRVEGRNGSGKSTLLRIASGALVPSAGRVTGRPSTGYVPERFPASGLGFSAQEYLRHLSRIHGLPGREGETAVDDWLERLEATDYAAAPLRTLSKGTCQKVAVAQALLARLGLLVLDEAWTGLDQPARGVLDAAVRERLADGATVLFVDHDLTRLADRVDERWQLAGAGMQVAAGRQDPAAADQLPANATMAIELTGLESGSVQRLARLSGVVAVEPGAEPRAPVVLRVAGRDCDAVLRAVLSWDGVRVRAVRPWSR